MENKIRNIIDQYLKKNSSDQENQFLTSWLERLQQTGTSTIADKETVENRLHNKIVVSQKVHTRRMRFRRTATWAACLTIPLLSGVFLWNQYNSSTNVYYAEKTTSITLDDNTIIILEPGTTLEINDQYNTSNRSVKLKGTALFKVAKNRDLPFLVKSDHLNTTVLGTTFTVSDKASNSHKVRVIEGIVSVENPKDSSLRILHANDSLVWHNNRLAHNTLLAQTSYFDFNNISLDKAIKQLEEYYRIHIHVDHRVSTQTILHGQYPKHELFAILRSICFLEDLSYKKQDKEISIFKK
ncbi:FecR family protein [Myroides odoratimimus]|uniref:FecR family protein n=1 Tax=Myroides odoratimimus TaxID=76832 RepID=UPI0025786E52|nr:FecR family protein [Myroides odoratimimus]MDM1398010.1 FecR family protein [Myroides odoratimimus]